MKEKPQVSYSTAGKHVLPVLNNREKLFLELYH